MSGFFEHPGITKQKERLSAQQQIRQPETLESLKTKLTDVKQQVQEIENKITRLEEDDV